MSVFHLINKVTLGQVSKFSPGLSTFNGSLALTWIGTDGQYNLLFSTDGSTWTGKRLIGGSGASAPALGAAGGGLAPPTEFVAYRGANGSLMVGQLFTSRDSSGNVTGEATDHAPSLSSKNIAWTGFGNPHLNVASCQSGPSNPASVPTSYIVGKTTSSESSDAGPCLCDFNGETLIGWRGSGNFTLNVAQVSGGNIVNKKPIPQYSDYSPALAGVGSNLYMAWVGSGNPQLNIMSSPNGYSAFGGLAVLSDASGSAPALLSYKNNLYLAWTGLGNGMLNVAQVAGPGLGGL